MKTKFVLTCGLLFFGLSSSTAFGDLLFDQDVTPDVIFGSGNANGGWTVDRDNGIELGLRAKLRFDEMNQPQNVFNSNGNGTYTFNAGQPVGGGFSFANGSPSTAVWNFEWSINSDFDASTNSSLSALTYLLEIDFDPTQGTAFLPFDPVNLPVADHAIGNNSTGNGGGISTSDPSTYVNLIANNNVAQNSWNMEFFDGMPFPFDANDVGSYQFRLTAFDGATQLAQTTITINSVPEPTASLLIGCLIVATGLRRSRGM